MKKERLLNLLKDVETGKIKAEEAAESLKTLPFEEIGDFARIDNHRELRTGKPEVVFCQGKTPEQIATIMEHIWQTADVALGTRATEEDYLAVKKVLPEAEYSHKAGIVYLKRSKEEPQGRTIAVITAGTADIPAAEEAAVTAEVLGNRVNRIYDVGVAGIHRLFAKMDEIRQANVIIVAAGMEGALVSVVGGLVDKPVIGLPTSIGYGSGEGGRAALLSMLNSCANGVAVVNIDNGFGAGYMASTINNL